MNCRGEQRLKSSTQDHVVIQKVCVWKWSISLGPTRNFNIRWCSTTAKSYIFATLQKASNDSSFPWNAWKPIPRYVQNRRINCVWRKQRGSTARTAKQLCFMKAISLTRSFRRIVFRNTSAMSNFVKITGKLTKKFTSLEKFRKLFSRM